MRRRAQHEAGWAFRMRQSQPHLASRCMASEHSIRETQPIRQLVLTGEATSKHSIIGSTDTHALRFLRGEYIRLLRRVRRTSRKPTPTTEIPSKQPIATSTICLDVSVLFDVIVGAGDGATNSERITNAYFADVQPTPDTVPDTWS